MILEALRGGALLKSRSIKPAVFAFTDLVQGGGEIMHPISCAYSDGVPDACINPSRPPEMAAYDLRGDDEAGDGPANDDGTFEAVFGIIFRPQTHSGTCWTEAI